MEEGGGSSEGCRLWDLTRPTIVLGDAMACEVIWRRCVLYPGHRSFWSCVWGQWSNMFGAASIGW